MIDDLSTLFRAIFYGHKGTPLGGVDFRSLPKKGAGGQLRRFAQFLAGEKKESQEAGAFLSRGAELLTRELGELLEELPEIAGELRTLVERIRSEGSLWDDESRHRLWRLFFPEGSTLEADREGAIADLRRRRTLSLTEMNPNPIGSPLEEILFTSNVLLTLPESREKLEDLALPEELKHRIAGVMDEPQRYFYDHPIHIGVELESNEAFYGLRGLDSAIEFEKERGRVGQESKGKVILSLSVTHEGLHSVARDYLAAELQKAASFEHLEVYLFTEPEAQEIVNSLLASHLPDESREAVRAVFGVDGEYGRHYSFLKAVAAFWKVFVDPRLRGTFKIDLDQVFPQKELLEQSGESALDHFKTPLWGARGVDHRGREVELGMIAGALVNEKDIGSGLFTPDVPIPEEVPQGEAIVFFNKLPMALSTRAEMMTRYDDGMEIDGESRALHRIHVTGGTNGILLEHLRRHRPFTPTFVGRAEDQAYLLSVLFEGPPTLRYLHKPGLIMRHDKEAFAGASIAAAEHGRFVGDLARTLLFTKYAEALPWGFEKIKEEIDPFTGCFVTRRRYAVVFLRLALKAASLIEEGRSGEAEKLLRIADRKLSPLLPGRADSFDLAAAYQRERGAWHAFYDALDLAEEDGPPEPPESLLERARLV